MRKVFTVVALVGLVSACSSSGSDGADQTTSAQETTTGSEVTSGSSTPADGTGSAGSVAPTTFPIETMPPLETVAVPQDCPPVAAPTTVPVLPDPVEKPEIKLPTTTPTELVITDLTTGEGREAQVGDQVQVYYIGVLSDDGTEFDSNFGSGTPFPVTIGQNSVIQGWEQGLLGVQPGTRRQLDIPADLGYGATGAGEDIPPNATLTFIVDVVSVKAGPPAADPADEPTYEFPTITGPAEFETETIVEGDRCEFAQIGSTVYVNAKIVRADTGEVLDNSWAVGSGLTVTLDESTIWGIAQGVAGMGVGEQRVITIPPEVGLTAAGNVQAQLDPTTVILAYVELVGLA